MKKKNLQWYKNKFTSQSPPWFDKIAGISSIVGVILSLLSFWGIDFGALEKQHKGIILVILVWLETRRRILLVIWIVIIFFVLVMMIIKYRNSAIIKMNASAMGLSHIANKTREYIDNLNGVEVVIDNKQCQNCQHLFALQRKALYTNFVQYTISFLDELTEVISDYVSYDVSACIKMVVNGKMDSYYGNENEKIEDKKVVTLARNSKSNEERMKKSVSEPQSIEKNSDFYDIVNGSRKENAPYFYAPNLKKYSKKIAEISNGQHLYLNSTENWEEYYIGTVVVPIGSISPLRNMRGYTVLGFLCVDSLYEKAFSWKQKDINVKLVQGFASIYSMALKEYEIKLKSLVKSEE